MVKSVRVFFVVGLVLLFVNSAGAAVVSHVGAGTQEDPVGIPFTVNMSCVGGGTRAQTTTPTNHLTFGVASTQAPFTQQPYFPTYTDAAYGCGEINAVAIDTRQAAYTGRVQAVVKYNLGGSGATTANLRSATLTGLRASDYHRTTNITTAMGVGVYDLPAANKTNGVVDGTVIYPRGTRADVVNVSFIPGQTFTVDVTDAVRGDLAAGRTFSGFVLYAESTPLGMEEVAFDYPTLVLDTTAPIPTMTEWGMVGFAALLIGFALWYMRKRRRIC